VDYAAIARAAGIHAMRIEEPKDVRAGLTDALGHPGPALVDLVTDPNALSMPPHISAAQVKGFALAATKTVLGGGGGQDARHGARQLAQHPGGGAGPLM
jgi:pyruvate dehydrogenase (quinone)